MKIGYARTSTTNQNIKPQLELLDKAGCGTIFEEQISGKESDNRERLQSLLEFIRDGDVVVVTKLDRLARSTKDLLSIAAQITAKNAELEILNINLDTSTPTGKLMLTMLGAIAQFERELMIERQYDGIQLAKQEGKYKGRKPVDAGKLDQVRELVESQGVSIAKACKQIGIARATYYNHM